MAQSKGEHEASKRASPESPKNVESEKIKALLSEYKIGFVVGDKDVEEHLEKLVQAFVQLLQDAQIEARLEEVQEARGKLQGNAQDQALRIREHLGRRYMELKSQHLKDDKQDGSEADHVSE